MLYSLTQPVVHCSNVKGWRLEKEGIEYKFQDKGDCGSILYGKSESRFGSEGNGNTYSHVE